MNLKVVLVGGFITLSSFGCSSPEEDHPKLLDSAPEVSDDSLSAEEERLRKMQLVRVINSSTDEQLEITPTRFSTGLMRACGGIFQDLICDQGQANNCDRTTCFIQLHQCQGEHLLAVASGTGSSVTIPFAIINPDGSTETIQARVPPQTAATSAGLAVQATKSFEKAIATATEALSGGCDALETETEFTGGVSTQAYAAAGFMNAFDAGKRAYRLAYQNTLDVSDAELSSGGVLGVVRIRAISKEALSRTAAAHLMVGGKAGWLGSTADAFCTGSRLTGPEEAALSVFREAALNPADVVSDTIPTNALVNGASTNPPQFGSVRERLEDAWGTAAIPANRPVWEAYGLKEVDFDAARKALADEIKIFTRTFAAKLEPRQLPEGETPSFDRFAGATGNPPNRPDQYWALLSLLDATQNNNLTGTWRPESGFSDILLNTSGLPMLGADNLASFVDRAYSWARYIAETPALSQTEVLDPLALLLGGDDIRGRLMHCTEFEDDQDQDLIRSVVRVAGYEAADELVLVRGEDLMDCAVNGHVEGARCEACTPNSTVPCMPDILDLPPPEEEFNSNVIRLTAEEDVEIGRFETLVKATFTTTIRDRYYLIRPRQKGDLTPGAGEWELLLGTPLFPRLQVGQFCRDVPIVPEAIEGAANAIAPSRDWCGSSEVSCAKVKYDERLPLEDELSTDHDDLESSWRHYLDLARSAVDHADALGQEFVDASLQEDFREEELDLRQIQREDQAVAEFQKIQEICGAAADPNKILELLGLDEEGNIDLGAFIEAGGCPPGTFGVCGFREIADTHPELGALAACLGSFGRLEEMHLGDGFLCVGDEGTIYDTDPNIPGEEKPRIRLRETCRDTSGSGPPDDVGLDEGCDPGYHCLPTEDGLGLFNTASLVPDPPLPSLCDGIRLLRAQPVDGDLRQRKRLYETIISQPGLTEDALSELLADTVLHFDGGVGIVTLGTLFPNISSQPGSRLCGSANEGCPNGEGGLPRDGLLCRKFACDNPADRAELNLRLYKAGAAFGGSIETIWYLNHHLQPVASDWGRDQWRLFDPDENRSPHQVAHRITVPTGTQLGFVMGGQPFPVLGPLPTLTDESGSPAIGDDFNNRRMTLAFRKGEAPRTPFEFHLLNQRPDPGSPAGEVSITPKRAEEGEALIRLGLVRSRFCLPQVDPLNSAHVSGACELNYDLARQQNQTGSDFLRQHLLDLGLEHFPTTGVQIPFAPATRHGSIQGTASPVFGTQEFPTPPGNGSTTSYTVDVEARLDAIELACLAVVGDDTRRLDEGCGTPVTIRNTSDFELAGNQLECLGNQITHRAATAVYRLPRGALDFLRNGERLFDSTGGSLAVTVSDLRSSLLEAATSGPIVGGTLRRFGQDLRALRAQLDRNAKSGEIAELQLESTIAEQATACITSAAEAFTLEKWGGGAVAAAATCANSIAQIGFAVQIEKLNQQELVLAQDQAIAEFGGRVSDYVQTLEIQGLRLSQALEGIQRNLESIESLKSEALRAVQSAVWTLSRQAANQQQISTTLNSIKVGKFIRYDRAFKHAQKMAFFAKRAIEMRLGMSLAEMAYDLPLVDAPATWEATVCQRTGINYEALAARSLDRPSVGAGGVPVIQSAGENFADAFLGEYVTKLEQVVESYRLVNNFHEGSDTVVVSLRDDIFNTRASCNVESQNQLYWASNLEPRFSGTGEDPIGWTLTGCEMATFENQSGTFEAPPGPCILTRQLNESPFFAPFIGETPVAAWSLEFGDEEWCDDPDTCSYRDGAALSQQVKLEPGRYRLSWYTPDEMRGGSGTNVGRVRHADGTEFPIVFPLDAMNNPERGFAPGIDPDWSRVFFEFDVFTSELVTVAFERPSATATIVPLAAPMLEKLEDPLHARTEPEPPSFSDTTDVRRESRPICEDTTGANFRVQKWHRNCLKLCPNGYASNCTDQARTECYWETSFNVNQRSIEAGHAFNQSGFARGNYNYRIKSLGLNFVGTDLRACEDSSLPTTCNAAGFIPYTILHAGPYYVRSHKGQDYRVALFPGRIEHARGLGIERYVTNPMGDADRTLIEPYLRNEFNGRPLDGEFILRVWDEPGVNFAAIQDVQLIIDYGYWTRFN